MTSVNARVEEAKKVYELFWDSYQKGDIDAFASTLDDNFEMIGTSESEICHSKKDGIAFFKGQMEEVIGLGEMRNRHIKLLSKDPYMLVNEDCDIYVLADSEWSFYSKIRISTWLLETEAGWKITQQHGSFPDMRVAQGETLAIEKINKENLELHDAIKRRTIELENKSKELEIEASLEKVRAVAMGMKKPEDMLDVCRVISTQLRHFGVDKIRNIQTAIIDENIGQYLCYQYFTPYDKTTIEKTEYLKSPVEHEMVRQMLASRDGHFKGSLSGKELEDFGLHRKEENHFPDPLLDEAKELDYCFLSIGEGGLGLTLYQPFAEEILTLFKRFHQVFSLAYQRFRDIQKAETQAREAEIELALERVRARTMAMQKSEELAETASLLFEQISNLGIQTWTSGFNIWEHEDASFMGYNPTPTGGITAPYRIPSTEDNFFKTILKAKRRGEDFLVFESKGKSLAATYQYMKTLPIVKDVLYGIEGAGIELPTSQINHCVFFSYGFLLFITLEPHPDSHLIFQRFGKVFQQTYTRFLDLQKAEAQAREAKIETALEKVRSRSLAMHKSDELNEVVKVLFEKMTELEVPSTAVAIQTFSESSKDVHCFVCGDVGTGIVISQYVLPYFDHPILEDFHNARGKELDFYVGTYSKKEKDSFYDVVLKLPELKDLPAEVNSMIRESEVYEITMVPAKKSVLAVNDFHGNRLSEDQVSILKRFARVFDQTYTRFLDLQKAEAQAKEAQIEAALERVRSRAMAMHESNELLEAGALLYRELSKLGIEKLTSGYVLIKEDEKMSWNYGINPVDGSVRAHPTGMPLQGNEVLKSIYVSWKKQESKLVIELNPEETIKHQTYIADNCINFPIPKEKLLAISPERLKVHTFNFTYGYLLIVGGTLLTIAQQELVIRFAKVFEMTYTRFLDLQKAEAQAREAEIELALERVRARTMAMQHSEELLEVATVLFQQVKGLGVPQWNCGFNIWELGEEAFTYYPGTPDGIINPSPCKIPLNEHPVFRRFDDSRKKGIDLLVYEKEGEEQKDHYEYMFSLPGVGDLLKSMLDAGFELPTYQIDHLANFAYGNLIFITYEHFPEMHKVFKRFAKVFEQTYTRFLDLQKAEAQAREAQISLAVERVRARALAMFKSDEILEVVFKLKEEIMRLDIPGVAAAAILLKEKNGKFRSWDLTSFEMNGENMHLPLDIPFEMEKTDPGFYLRKVWKEGSAYSVIVQDEKSLQISCNWLREHHKIKEAEEAEQFIKSAHITKSYHPTYPLNQGRMILDLLEPPSKEIESILSKMGGAFDLAYKRFEDLEKAESQAREAQIEAAMERIRSRAIAMRTSEELMEVMIEIRRQIDSLGQLDLEASVVHLYTEKEPMFESIAAVRPPGESGEIVLADVYFPVDAMDQIELMMDMYASKTTEYTIEFNKQKAEEWQQVMLQYAPTIAERRVGFVNNRRLSDHSEFWNFADFNGGSLLLVTHSPASNDTKEVLRKASKVFDLAYGRYKDLLRAEARARESQIEAALERIRGQVASMRESTELLEIMVTMRSEFVALGHEAHYFWHMRWLPDSYEKAMTSGDGTQIGMVMSLPRRIHGDIKLVADWEKGSDPILVLAMETEIAVDYVEKMITWGDFERVDPQAPTLDDIRHIQGLTFVMARTSHGEIGFSLPGSVPNPPKESMDTLVRFAKVFDLAYKRFEDLKKAEHQTRETQIELALERVRSRSMAMQRSEELQEVIQVVYQQFLGLGIPIEHTGFIMDYKNREDMNIWLADSNQFHSEITFPYFDSPHWNSFVAAKAKGEDFFTNLLDFEAKNSFYKVLFELIPDLPQEKQDFYFAQEGLSISTVLLDNVGLYIENYTTTPFTEEENRVLMRFGKVFQQTYTRFLDLQKAEAQARETEIQLALERIRAKTMAMKTQSDLLGIIELFGQQLIDLTVRFTDVTFIEGAITKNRDWELWSHVPNADNFTHKIHIPYIDTPFFTKTAMAVEEYERTGKSIQTKFFSKAEKDEFLDHYWKYAPAVPEKIMELVYSNPGSTIADAFLEKVTVSIVRWDLEPFSDEELSIFERFAKEFKQTYTRFLDIKKAEAQAREAEIELALERVRARTMAMRSSDELAEASSLLFQQMEALGVHTYSSGFTIWDEKQGQLVSWMCNADGSMNPPFRMPIEEEKWHKEQYNSWKKGDDFTVKDLNGEEMKSYFRYLRSFPLLDEAFKKSEFAGHLMPERQVHHAAHFSQGNLLFITLDPIPRAHDIFTRFAKVFDQTYTRFLDLQKAEAQARESEIELALERIRARTMAMQRSEEIASILADIFKGLAQLDMTLVRVLFWVFHPEKKTFSWWSANSEVESTATCFEVPFTDHPVFQTYLKAWQEKTPLLLYDFEGELKISWQDFLFHETELGQLPEAVKKGMNDEGKVCTTSAISDFGLVMTGSEEPLSSQNIDIIQRFGKTFQQSYTRYRDVQKAEAQAREAKIETALEKVRSRTMGMQSSNELPEVANLLFLEVQALGIPAWSCGYCILLEDRRSSTCIMSSEGTLQKPFMLPHYGEASFEEWDDFVQSDRIFFTQELGGKAIESHYGFMKSLPQLTPIFKEIEEAGLSLPTYQINHLCKFSQGFLLFITYEAVPDAHDLFKRFTKVFEQTYTRFLDLKKAEAQAQEARIEAALERVRSRTMGMQKAEELGEVATVLFGEMNTLVDNLWTCGFVLCEKNRKEDEWWLSLSNGLIKPFSLPNIGDYAHEMLYEGWKKGEAFRTVTLENEQLIEHYDWLMRIPIAQQIFEDMEGSGISRPNWQRLHAAYFKTGYLVIITEVPCEEEEIFKRFAQVFDLTYTRFLDLQKAEKQAREAQIEAALERIRSRAMAMQNSEELRDVALELRTQMGILGQKDLEVCAIHLYEEHKDHFESWAAMHYPGKEKRLLQFQALFPKSGKLIIDEMMDCYASDQNEYVLVNEGEKGEQWFELLREKAPEAFHYLMEAIANIPAEDMKAYWGIADFSGGALVMVTYYYPDKDSLDLLRRTANVFGLAYKRFKDLRLAEVSTREAMRQASLDRIRADISSMRNAHDLDRITPLIFKELTVLGVPFIRCGVFIIQEKQKIVEAYLSSPEGNSLGVLRLPYKASELTYQTVEAWRKGEVLRQHWNKENFMQWIEELMEQDQIQDSSTYQGTAAPPESLDLHFVPFAQGMLYVGAVSPLDEKELELVQALAKAFSVAYARYEDFIKLEQAKAEVESAMSELKSTQAQLIQSEKMASLGELTAGIAHEIQNPLNFVNNFSEVSSEMIEELDEEIEKGDKEEAKAISADIRENLNKIAHHGKRADAIVKGMLEHSRANKGEKTPTDLNALADEFVRLSYHGLRAKDKSFNADFTLDLDPNLPKVNVVASDIGRVILNLVNNAFYAVDEKAKSTPQPPKGGEKYTPTISVSSSVTKSPSGDLEVQISVQDNGLGIPEHIKEKIFQPFFTTKPTGSGTGLGLSLSYDIIKAHAGEIKIESKEGEGTKFIIILPIDPAI